MCSFLESLKVSRLSTQFPHLISFYRNYLTGYYKERKPKQKKFHKRRLKVISVCLFVFYWFVRSPANHFDDLHNRLIFVLLQQFPFEYVYQPSCFQRISETNDLNSASKVLIILMRNLSVLLAVVFQAGVLNFCS